MATFRKRSNLARPPSLSNGSMGYATFMHARVQARLDRFAEGYPGDVERVGEGVSELRINYGPGYRVFFKARGRDVVILLAGGHKGTQAKDIKVALRLARNLPE